MLNEKIIQSFSPGENFKIELKWLKYNLKPIYRHIEVVSPSRLHFSILDYSYMSLSKIGGGGIGISSSINEIKIELFIDNNKNFTNFSPVEKHILLLFCKLVNYRGDNINIKVYRNEDFSHSGYGSTVSLITGLFYGLNLLFNQPFSKSEIFEILTNNYVEQSDEEKNHFGYETGVGESCLLYGGFNMISKTGEYIGKISTENLYTLVLQGNKFKLSKDILDKHLINKATTSNETYSINKYGLEHQKKYGKNLDNLISGYLEKAFTENNINEFYNHIWALNKYGSFKRKLTTFNNDVMLGFEKVSIMNGALYSGISSAGPSLFVLSDDINKLNCIKKQTMDLYHDFFDKCYIGEAGNKIKIKSLNY